MAHKKQEPNYCEVVLLDGEECGNELPEGHIMCPEGECRSTEYDIIKAACDVADIWCLLRMRLTRKPAHDRIWKALDRLEKATQDVGIRK